MNVSFETETVSLTMNDDVRGLVIGLFRETGMAAVTWIGVLTGLFATLQLGMDRLEARMATRRLPARRVYEFLPIDQGPILAQWLDWVVAYSTMGFGDSVQFSEPVFEIVVAGFTRSAYLLGAALLVGLVLAVPLCLAAARLGDGLLGSVFVAPAYGFSTVWPLPVAVTVLVVAVETEAFGTSLTRPMAEATVTNYTLLVLLGAAVATPLVADAVRRVHRRRVSDETASAVPNAFGTGGLGTLECWAYVGYAVSALAVVEYVVNFRGLGYYFVQAVVNYDVALFLGLIGAVAIPLVALASFRNLAILVARFVRSDTSADGDGADGSADAGAGATDVEPSDPAANGPDARTVARVVAGRSKTVAGALVLAGAIVLGLGGSLLMGPESANLREAAAGMGPGQVLNTAGSLLTVAAVAAVVALVLGAGVGLASAALRRSEVPFAGPITTLLRIPAEVWLVAPLAFATAALLVVLGGATGRTLGELVVGGVGGFVLAAFTFRAVYEAGLERLGTDRDRAGAAAESLVAGLARVDGVAATVVVVAGEIVFLGLVPFESMAPAFAELNRGFTQLHTLVSDPGQLLVLVAQASLATAGPVLGIALLGDGLGEAAAELRSRTAGSGSDPARADPDASAAEPAVAGETG